MQFDDGNRKMDSVLTKVKTHNPPVQMQMKKVLLEEFGWPICQRSTCVCANKLCTIYATDKTHWEGFDVRFCESGPLIYSVSSFSPHCHFLLPPIYGCAFRSVNKRKSDMFVSSGQMNGVSSFHQLSEDSIIIFSQLPITVFYLSTFIK